MNNSISKAFREDLREIKKRLACIMDVSVNKIHIRRCSGLIYANVDGEDIPLIDLYNL